MVTYNAWEWAKVAISSILGKTDFPGEVRLVVYDNSDRKMETQNLANEWGLRRWDLQNCRLLFSSKNVGFTRGHNTNMRLERDWDYVVLMNDDTEIPARSRDWLAQIVRALDSDQRIASVAPVTVMRNNRIYYAGITGRRRHAHGGIPDNPRKIVPKVTATEWNNMAVCAMRRGTMDRVGLLNEQRPHFGSDEEWCRKASSMGYIHVVIPLRIRHYHHEPGRKWISRPGEYKR